MGDNLVGETFDFNKHEENYRFTVYIDRLKEECEVDEIKILARDVFHRTRAKNHLWGFATDKNGNIREWDVTWGDKLTQHLIEKKDEKNTNS